MKWKPKDSRPEATWWLAKSPNKYQKKISAIINHLEVSFKISSKIIYLTNAMKPGITTTPETIFAFQAPGTVPSTGATYCGSWDRDSAPGLAGTKRPSLMTLTWGTAVTSNGSVEGKPAFKWGEVRGGLLGELLASFREDMAPEMTLEHLEKADWGVNKGQRGGTDKQLIWPVMEQVPHTAAP